MAVQTREDMVASIEEHGGEIRVLGVRRPGLFGSFIRGEAGTDSDVDVLVEFEQDEKTFDNFLQLSFFLEDLFQRRIELVTPESLSPYLRPYIMKEVEYVPVAA